MTFLRWYRCTMNSCRCHRVAPSQFRSVRPTFEDLVNEAITTTVFEELGASAQLPSDRERHLTLALSNRLRALSDGPRVRACPWQHAREVLAAEYSDDGAAPRVDIPVMRNGGRSA